jgi:tripartite-type tricarboxylate transporter receptor subunit TctC
VGKAVKRIGSVTLALSLANLCASARAQEHFPSRLITVVVPLTAGTTADILARLFAEGLSRRFDQRVVVSNRPGAGGLIGAQAVGTGPADGYTILLANSAHTILGALNKNLPFDPIADFAGIYLIGEAPAVVNVVTDGDDPTCPRQQQLSLKAAIPALPHNRATGVTSYELAGGPE